MPFPFIGAALPAIAPALAKRGLDLLSGIFRGAVNQGADKVSEWIKEKTGIDVNDIAEGKITEGQWVKLKAFEPEHQEQYIYAFVITGLTFVFIFMAAFFPALFDKELPDQSWSHPFKKGGN